MTSLYNTMGILLYIHLPYFINNMILSHGARFFENHISAARWTNARDHLSLFHHCIIHKYKLCVLYNIIYIYTIWYVWKLQRYFFFHLQGGNPVWPTTLSRDKLCERTTIMPAVSLVFAKDFSSHKQSVRRESSHSHTHWILSSSRINHVEAECCHFRRSAGP